MVPGRLSAQVIYKKCPEAVNSGRCRTIDRGTGSRWGQLYTCRPKDKFLGLPEWWESCGRVFNDAFRCRSGSIALLQPPQLLLKVTLLFDKTCIHICHASLTGIWLAFDCHLTVIPQVVYGDYYLPVTVSNPDHTAPSSPRDEPEAEQIQHVSACFCIDCIASKISKMIRLR